MTTSGADPVIRVYPLPGIREAYRLEEMDQYAILAVLSASPHPMNDNAIAASRIYGN